MLLARHLAAPRRTAAPWVQRPRRTDAPDPRQPSDTVRPQPASRHPLRAPVLRRGCRRRRMAARGPPSALPRRIRDRANRQREPTGALLRGASRGEGHRNPAACSAKSRTPKNTPVRRRSRTIPTSMRTCEESPRCSRCPRQQSANGRTRCSGTWSSSCPIRLRPPLSYSPAWFPTPADRQQTAGPLVGPPVFELDRQALAVGIRGRGPESAGRRGIVRSLPVDTGGHAAEVPRGRRRTASRLAAFPPPRAGASRHPPGRATSPTRHEYGSRRASSRNLNSPRSSNCSRTRGSRNATRNASGGSSPCAFASASGSAMPPGFCSRISRRATTH